MNIYRAREELKKGKTIYDIKLRVVYYARVSTLKEEQKSSIDNQQDYYKNFILNNHNWTLVREYVDEGISGMHAEKRENFQRMIQDAKDGEFDLIITKEIARFARNTLDSIQYTRQLLGYGVAVWFQTDSINTIDDDSELRLAIMSSLAQDELRKLSSRIKFGHAQSIKKGHVLGTDNLYGYRKKDCKLQIVEEEAEMVRMIFELYATGEWTTPKIEKHLYELGYRNSKGEKINRGVIGNIITNPKYKGYFVGGKVKIVDMFTKKQEFLPEEDWMMFKDDTGEIVPAIVSESLWCEANRIFEERGKIIKGRRTSYKGENLYTGKIVCGLDGCHYWLNEKIRRGKRVGSWTCSGKRKNGFDSCKSVSIKESELNSMLSTILNEHVSNMEEMKQKYISIYQKMMQKETKDEESVRKLETQLKEISLKKSRLLDISLDGLITKSDFKSKNDALTEKEEKIKSQLKEMNTKENEQSFSDYINNMMESIKEYEGIQPEDITRSIVDKLIDKIVITPIDDNTETVDFYLRNDGKEYGLSRVRSVNMFKKMIEQQEKMMAEKNQG